MSFCLSAHLRTISNLEQPHTFLWYRICLQCRRPGFDPWVRKIPWRREWQPAPVFLPGEFHGQRSLVGYSPWGCKESDMTGRLMLFTFTPFCIIVETYHTHIQLLCTQPCFWKTQQSQQPQLSLNTAPKEQPTTSYDAQETEMHFNNEKKNKKTKLALLAPLKDRCDICKACVLFSVGDLTALLRQKKCPQGFYRQLGNQTGGSQRLLCQTIRE